MRPVISGVAFLVFAALVSPANAEVLPPGAEARAVSAGPAPRDHRELAWVPPAGMSSVGLAGWTALWDDDTGVPAELWGPSIAAPGAMASPAVAEACARRFLASHLGLLAPGATPEDFELIANVRSGDGEVRSVGFAQRAAGLRVLGGSIAFAFKRDRLALVSSTALPRVTVTLPAQPPSAAAIAGSAVRWLARGGRTTHARTGAAPGGRVIVPIVRPRVGATPEIIYRVAEQVTIESLTGPGGWQVWIDAATAAPIARESTISYAAGRVLFDVPDRYPGGARTPQPALATHVVNGVATLAAADGSVTWDGTAAASVALQLAGPRVAITDHSTATATPFTETLSLADAGTLIWSHPGEELIDAQLDAFVFAGQAKAFARARLAPDLGYLDQQLSVTVNEDQTCNAFSTGDDLHFFRGSQRCENTGRIADVVYHEFGHSLHAHSIIPGFGQFNAALSEGLADTLAAAITGDHGIARGFFFDSTPLRDLDPAGTEKRWPGDTSGEPHNDGEIIGETMWDLRTGLVAGLGEAAGIERWLRIYYGVMQRAADIPSSYAAALLADDDDGDLSNGTPDECAISTAFATHGLLNPAFRIPPPVRDGTHIALHIPARVSACQGPSVIGAVATWRLRGASDPGSRIALSAVDGGFAGELPPQADGTVVQYNVVVTWSDGKTTSYPQNPGDPYYELYAGPVTALWCDDFESGAGGWVTGGVPDSANEWQTGAPAGLGGDPRAAYSGTGVLGMDLTGDGMYPPSSSTFAESPPIDLAGHTHVRLQYQRWLGVEDGLYDQARILANGTEVWRNYASVFPPPSGVSHRDREWRFQDIDLSSQAATGTIKLRFELQSDEGLELGGWTLDHVCLVTPEVPVTHPPASDAGGCSAGRDPHDAALALLVVGLVRRRRRRRSAAIDRCPQHGARPRRHLPVARTRRSPDASADTP